MSHDHNLNSQKSNIKKTNWIFVGIFLFIVLIAGAFVLSNSPTASNQPQAGQKAAASKLTAAETFFDFGTISMAKGKVTKAFTVKNTTGEPITVSKVYTSCMCTQAVITSGNDRKGPFGMPGHGGSIPTISLTIAPNSEAVVEVIFDPAAHGPSGVGPIQRNVFVESTDSGKLTLEFKANVTP
ncbi:MAG: DUF1573 domain-containing protein [Patescibacteria group bacterium]